MEITRMPAERIFAENDPLHHTTRLKRMLTDIIDHAREDTNKIADQNAKALLQKTVETLSALRKEYEDYENGDSTALRQAS
jgi:hypothetical protein